MRSPSLKIVLILTSSSAVRLLCSRAYHPSAQIARPRTQFPSLHARIICTQIRRRPRQTCMQELSKHKSRPGAVARQVQKPSKRCAPVPRQEDPQRRAAVTPPALPQCPSATACQPPTSCYTLSMEMACETLKDHHAQQAGAQQYCIGCILRERLHSCQVRMRSMRRG